MKIFNLYILYTICISLLLCTIHIHAKHDLSDETELDFIDVSFSPSISNNDWYYFRGLYNNTHTSNGNFTYTIQYSQAQDLVATKFEHFYCTIIDAVTRDILHELHQKPIYDNTTDSKQPFLYVTSDDIIDFPFQKSTPHCIFQCLFILPNTTSSTTLSTIDSNGYNNYYNDINGAQANFTYSIKFTLQTTPQVETEQPITILQHTSLYPFIPTIPTTKVPTTKNILSLSKYPLDKHKPSWYIGNSLYYDTDVIFPSKLSTVSLEFIHWDLLLDISHPTNPFKTNQTTLTAIGLHSHSMSSWFLPNIIHTHHSFNCQINHLNITAHWYKVPTSIPTENNNIINENILPSTVYLMLLLPNHLMEELPNSSQLTHLHITCGQHVPLSMYHTTIEPLYPNIYQPSFDITYFQSVEFNSTTLYKPLYTSRIPITTTQLDTAPIALPFAQQLNYMTGSFPTLIPLSTSTPAIPEIDGSNDYKTIIYGRFYVNIRSTPLVNTIQLHQIENEIYHNDDDTPIDGQNNNYIENDTHNNNYNNDDTIDIFGLSNNNIINDDPKQDQFTLICPQIANVDPKKTIYLTIGRLATINENPGFHARINWTKSEKPTNTTLCLFDTNICESEPFTIPLSLFNKDEIDQKFIITIMAQGLTFIPSFAGSLQCYLKYAHYSNDNTDHVTYTYLTQTTHEYGTTFELMEQHNPIEIMALSTMKPAFRIITHGATIDRITVSLLGLHAFVTSSWKPITVDCLDSTTSHNTLSCSAENIIWSPTQVSFEIRASDITKRISQIECYIGTSLYSLTEYKTINEYPLPSPIDSVMATKYITITTRTFQNNYYRSLLPILPIDDFPPTSYGRLNWSLRDEEKGKSPLKQFLSLVITSAVIGLIVIALILIALAFIKRKRDGKTYFAILREWCIDQIDDGCPLLFPCCHVKPEDRPLLYADDEDYYESNNYHSATDIQEIRTHSQQQ